MDLVSVWKGGSCRRVRFWPSLFLFIAVCTFLGLPGCGPKKPPAVGDVPPEFTLTELKGGKIKFPDDFAGKVVVIRFWIDSCKSCEKEMPEIDRLYRQYKEKGLVVLAINAGQSRDAAEVFGTRLKITYPILLDPGSEITGRYGVKAVPFTFVVDTKGKITKRILGETERTSFEQLIQSLL
jgi:cytochrome c biogenesis protein CcmG, thiol:disulfide interchange protein DsbE